MRSVVGVLLIGAATALAPGALAHRSELTLQSEALLIDDLVFKPTTLLLGAAWHRQLADRGWLSALALGGGLRAGTPTAFARAPFEAFAELRVEACAGPWCPALGLELGLSGFQALPHRLTLGEIPQPLIEALSWRMGPGYVAFNTTWLRFAFAHFTLSALRLSYGTTLQHTGFANRFQLGLLALGGRF